MDKRISIFDYFSQVFMIYGITIMVLNIFCLLFGESAQGVSAIFSLGNEGLCVETSFQFLFAVGLIVILRVVLMTDYLIRDMSLTMRVILMFVGVLLVMLAFILVCRWLPADEPVAWLLFVVCFIISCTISTLISVLHEKQENKKLAEALEKIKEEQ